MLDHCLQRNFIPLNTLNVITKLNGARTTGISSVLNTDGFDLINFGSVISDRFTIGFMIRF